MPATHPRGGRRDGSRTRPARESLVGYVSAHHYIPPPLAGGLILAGYALAAALAAALTFTRRDLA